MVYSSLLIVSGGLKAKLALAWRKKALCRDQKVDLTLGQPEGAVVVLPVDSHITLHTKRCGNISQLNTLTLNSAFQ